MNIFRVLGEAVILARRCSDPHHFSLVDKCTNDKRLIQKFVSSSFDIQKTGFNVDTARGNICVCGTDTCNNAALESFKNRVSNTNNSPTIRDIAEDTSVIDDVTYSIMSHTSSSLDFVSIEEVSTNYWMNDTSSQGTASQNPQVTEINDQIQGQLPVVSTADNSTTRGFAAEQVKYNTLLMITITINMFAWFGDKLS